MALIFQGAFLSNSKQNWMEHILQIILPETNIAPDNGYLEDEFPFGGTHLGLMEELI